MANKTVIATVAGTILLATTAVASAQYTDPDPYYYGYYATPLYGYVAPAPYVPYVPGYYAYVPGPYYGYWGYYYGW
jgi:hypothetical protein